jgi:sulfite exporter TauE/SafE
MSLIFLSFITGLTTGGISCLAIQGGLLASALPEDKSSKNKLKYVLIFLISKIIAYSLLGFLLGLFGSIFTISIKSYAILQIFIGIYLMVTAGRIMNLHPFFKYLAITPPKFIFRLAKNQSKNATYFTPSILGALTVFMPCGVTQAMMIVAIGTRNPITSAGIMFAFILGTFPVFFALGSAFTLLLKKKVFSIIAGFIILIFGILALNSALILLNSPHTLQNYWNVINGNSNSSLILANPNHKGYQEVTITVKSNGYVSSVNTLKVNVPVKLKIVTNNIYSCARAFTIPQFNIYKILPETGEEIIDFTPTKTGRLTFSCSMGMYTGSFQVIP